MKMNNDCSIDNIGFLLYMEEQEKRKSGANGEKSKYNLEIEQTTPDQKKEK